MNNRNEDGELVEDAMEPGTDAMEDLASDGVEAQQMSETVLDHQLNNKVGGLCQGGTSQTCHRSTSIKTQSKKQRFDFSDGPLTSSNIAIIKIESDNVSSQVSINHDTV